MQYSSLSHRPALTLLEQWAAATLVQVACDDPDRAGVLNGVGFSGNDTARGHELAELAAAGRMSGLLWDNAVRLALRYRRQAKDTLGLPPAQELPAVDTPAFRPAPKKARAERQKKATPAAPAAPAESAQPPMPSRKPSALPVAPLAAPETAVVTAARERPATPPARSVREDHAAIFESPAPPRVASARSTGPLTLSGVVEKIFHSSPRWSAGKLRLLSDASDGSARTGALISFAGALYAREGDALRVVGGWKDDPKYGKQIAVTSARVELPLDVDGLARYLERCPAMVGVGLARARLLAATYGADLPAALRDAPEGVASATRIPLGVILALAAEWAARADDNATAVFLAKFELTNGQIETLMTAFGGTVVSILQADPYALLGQIPGYGFRKLDKIARAMGTPKEHPGRVRHGVVQTILDAEDEGHTWIEAEAAARAAKELLILDSMDADQIIEGALDAAVREGLLLSDSSQGVEIVGRAHLVNAERFAAERLALFARADSALTDAPYARSLALGLAPGLNVLQTDAVVNALTCGGSLVSGPAGSGKTYLLTAVIAAYEFFDSRVLLAAPTGKAARRMSESSGRPASTIHRLLGFDGAGPELARWLATSAKASKRARGGTQHAGWTAKVPDDWSAERYPDAPWIEAGLLVIDEMSMVDASLFAQLLAVVDPARTAILLVGDHNQLPSVGPGAVLRDLIRARVLPTTILTEIVRQAGVLKENSTAVLDGKIMPSQSGAGAEWFVMDKHEDPAGAADYLVALFERHLDRLKYDLFNDVQLLTPTHKGPLGTKELNIRLQSVLQRKVFSVTAPPVPPGESRRPAFLRGDKVIHTRNDYAANVMNGMVGRVVASLEPEARFVVVDYDGQRVNYVPEGGASKALVAKVREQLGDALADELAPRRKDDDKPRPASASLGNLQLAYALTVHKYQGSQVPCAILVVHKSHSFMLHRGLLYTAVTRAQKTALLVGDAWGMRHAAQRIVAGARQTWLSLLLSQAAERAPTESTDPTTDQTTDDSPSLHSAPSALSAREVICA